jgi:hypothetical protein
MKLSVKKNRHCNGFFLQEETIWMRAQTRTMGDESYSTRSGQA